eukprot:1138770-Pelagomonas_calceolata.AAC.2
MQLAHPCILDTTYQVLDVIDCTGSGDVDTSCVRKAGKDGTIEALSGRRLPLNPEWTNPSGDWRVGTKLLFDLIPSSVANRGKELRSSGKWTCILKDAWQRWGRDSHMLG